MNDAGIVYFIDNENVSAIAAGFTTGYMSVMILESQAEEAQALLKDIIAGSE